MPKISALPVGTTVDGTEKIPAVQAGATVYLTVLQIQALQIGVDQHITAAGPALVSSNSGIVRVDQTVGAPITLTMGSSVLKACGVLICDWKGDAGTNNITITLSGSDTFPGGLTSWVIASDTGSIFLRPISGVGYAL